MFDKFLRQTAAILCLVLAMGHAALAEPKMDWAPDYNIGDQFPDVSRLDQSGNDTQITPEQQTHLVLFSRSVVW